MTKIKSEKAKEYTETFWQEQPNKKVIQMAYVAGLTEAEARAINAYCNSCKKDDIGADVSCDQSAPRECPFMQRFISELNAQK